MKTLLVILALLIASPAFAISEAVVKYCVTTANPDQCISLFMQQELNAQRDIARQQYDAQIEAAQAQANGLAMFGAGNALIQGMNQGFRPLPYRQPTPITPLFGPSR